MPCGRCEQVERGSTLNERADHAARGRERGFTLIEVMTAISIAGILMAIATWGLIALGRSQQEQATANSVLASLRSAEARSQAEGRAYCVRFDNAQSWSLWRYSCDPADPVTAGSRVEASTPEGTALVSSVNFAVNPVAGLIHSCPVGGCAYFYPRGLASSGSVTVTRPGSSSSYKVTVVGITGRVFLTH